jgi:hypothetical protein
VSDPRQEERLRVQAVQRSAALVMPTQVMERIKRGLSPNDDELPFAQAVREKETRDQAAKAYHERHRRAHDQA